MFTVYIFLQQLPFNSGSKLLHFIVESVLFYIYHWWLVTAPDLLPLTALALSLTTLLLNEVCLKPR